jgi:hypothetical protein
MSSPFSKGQLDTAASRGSRLPESISETLFWLWDNGLIEWNGEYRNGRKVWVATEKARGRTPRGGRGVRERT